MSADSPLLEARNISRHHPSGGGWLLNQVSLAIRPGMRLSVSGPSGSGKTLMLRALAVLDPLDAGTICWKGTSVRRDLVPPFRARVMYLHQRAVLLEETVEAALRRPYSLKVQRPRRFDRDRAVSLLEQLQRDASFLEKSVGDLSGGEIQITALVRALQLDPTVLLLDEPTAALDPQATAAVEELIGGWVREPDSGRAFVWVSHDAEQARRVAERMVSMQAGRLSEDAN